jgi:hypothetical protein
VCDQDTSKTRRLKPATGLWKIQPQWVVTAGKQTNKTTVPLSIGEFRENPYSKNHTLLKEVKRHYFPEILQFVRQISTNICRVIVHPTIKGAVKILLKLWAFVNLFKA